MSGSEVSIIVPARNEEAHIGPCLEALLRQESDLHEVIVVDNGSTDRTIDIVREYAERSPKVILEHEPEPGVVHARNRGFDRATGEIIGRIDADTLVGSTWATAVREFFDTNPGIDAVTGLSYVYETPFATPVNRKVQRRVDEAEQPVSTPRAVLGHNMALKASTWRAVRDRLSSRTDIHEDLDLSIVLDELDRPIARDLRIVATVSARRTMTPPLRYWKYLRAVQRSVALHGRFRFRHRFVMAFEMLMHTLRWPVNFLYDAETDRIRLFKRPRFDSRALPVD